MRYRIRKINGDIIEGEKVETRGDDENYPTFLLDDGGRIGVHVSNVLGPVDDSCPVDGIERPIEPPEGWNHLEDTRPVWNEARDCF